MFFAELNLRKIHHYAALKIIREPSKEQTWVLFYYYVKERSYCTSTKKKAMYKNV